MNRHSKVKKGLSPQIRERVFDVAKKKTSETGKAPSDERDETATEGGDNVVEATEETSAASGPDTTENNAASETESAWSGSQDHVDRNGFRLAFDSDRFHDPYAEDAAHVTIGVV